MKLFSAVVLATLLIGGCAQKLDEKVAVIEKTHSYHRPNCSQVMMARATIATRDEARTMNCKPCPYCKPDQPQ